MQADIPSEDANVPAAHTEQTGPPPAPAEPSLHDKMQFKVEVDLSRSVFGVLGGHVLQKELPRAEEYVPILQLEHMDAPAAENVPSSHL